MKTVDLHLLGRSYQVACAPGEEERLMLLAKMVDDKMKLAAQAGQGAIGEIRLFLLAGLMLADEVLEARGDTEKTISSLKAKFAEEEDMLVSAVDHLAGRLNMLAARIEKV